MLESIHHISAHAVKKIANEDHTMENGVGEGRVEGKIMQSLLLFPREIKRGARSSHKRGGKREIHT